jgi:hypothetical protein
MGRDLSVKEEVSEIVLLVSRGVMLLVLVLAEAAALAPASAIHVFWETL